MRAYKIFDPELGANFARVRAPGAELSRLQWGSVKETTQKQYRSALRVLSRFIAAMRRSVVPTDDNAVESVCASCTPGEFTMFLSARIAQGCADAKMHRSALLLVQHAHQVDPFAGAEAFIRAERAVAAAARPSRVDKGCVTGAMLEDLCDWLHNAGWGLVANAARIGFAASLRISELRHLCIGDLQPDTQGLHRLTLRVTKSHRAGKAQSSAKVVSSEVNTPWQAVAQGRPHGAYLFPTSIGTLLTLALRTGAAALKWDAGLLWSGTHALRIGGAHAIAARASEALGAAVVGQSPPVFRKYALPNEQRKRARGSS